MKSTLILVEGVHDAEVVGKVLRENGFSQVRVKSEVNSIWEILIPKKFPVNDDLLERVSVPFFYDSTDSTVAVRVCNSVSKVEAVYKDLRDTIYPRFSGIDSIFVIVDSDKKSETEVRKSLVTSLSFPTPGKGVATAGGKAYGLFVVPNNSSQGTMESILTACGELNYPDLLENARKFVDTVDRAKLDSSDLQEIGKPFGREKAIIGVAANFLKPGKSVVASISDNRWISSSSIEATQLSVLKEYILPHL
ncbi:MAG: DUF3226 domain-containing protein [Spirochaetales bacterium]